jgi:hypothetical protein
MSVNPGTETRFPGEPARHEVGGWTILYVYPDGGAVLARRRLDGGESTVLAWEKTDVAEVAKILGGGR